MEVYRYFKEKQLVSDLIAFSLFDRNKSVFLTKIEVNKKADKFCQFSEIGIEEKADWRITFLMTTNKKHFSIYITKNNLNKKINEFQKNMFSVINGVMCGDIPEMPSKRSKTKTSFTDCTIIDQPKYNKKVSNSSAWDFIP